MTIVCPRCATPNSRWERRCIACWLLFDASLRAARAVEPAPSGDVKTATRPADDTKRTSADAANAAAEHAAHKSLSDQLGVEVEHVRALADNGIHTLEHVAESLPHEIARALATWTHIDPAALIARARALLHIQEPEPEPDRKSASPPEKNPDPAEWWKMT